MKGLLIAGGNGTRLNPITKGISKQLIPVYDKPMVYYPLTTLILAGVKDLSIIVTSKSLNSFIDLLGDGSLYGLNINYIVQKEPNGLAAAVALADDFLNGEPVIVVLGDNLFYGSGFGTSLHDHHKSTSGASIFCKQVENPRDFGVAELDQDGKVISIEEKPDLPKSDYAITGLYFYDGSAVERAKTLKPSARGEIEITDLNRTYLEDNLLEAKLLPRSSVWLDTGTVNGLSEASEFVRVLQSRQGFKIGCPEEAALRMGLLDFNSLQNNLLNYGETEYATYLKSLRL